MTIYPPRAEYKILPENLHKYDTGAYYAQPKLNGSACVVILGDTEAPRITKTEELRVDVFNRHGQRLTLIDRKNIPLEKLYRGTGKMILCGELLNKNKKGEDGQPFNQKFCIWDIIHYNGQSLEGQTVEERIKLISELYPVKCDCEPKYMSAIDNSQNCFLINTYESKFAELYEELIKVDVYEGLVLKLKAGKLKPYIREVNNESWQLKARKTTKNYEN